MRQPNETTTLLYPCKDGMISFVLFVLIV